MTCGRMYFGAPRGPLKQYGSEIGPLTALQYRTYCDAMGLKFSPKKQTCVKGRAPKGSVPKRAPRTLKQYPSEIGPMTVGQYRAYCDAMGLKFSPKKQTCVKGRAPKGSVPKRAPTGAPRGAARKYGDMTVAQWKQHCRNLNMVYDGMGGCRERVRAGAKKDAPKKPSAGRKAYNNMTVAQWKKHCRDQGRVYDGMGDCRDRLPRGRKAASFGMMHSTPASWRPGAIYYNASKFDTPNLLLGESFKAVANRAAKQAASASAAAVVDKIVDKDVVKSVDKDVVKAVDKAVDKAVEKAVEKTVSDVKAAFGRRRRVYRRRM